MTAAPIRHKLDFVQVPPPRQPRAVQQDSAPRPVPAQTERDEEMQAAARKRLAAISKWLDTSTRCVLRADDAACPGATYNQESDEEEEEDNENGNGRLKGTYCSLCVQAETLTTSTAVPPPSRTYGRQADADAAKPSATQPKPGSSRSKPNTAQPKSSTSRPEGAEPPRTPEQSKSLPWAAASALS